MALNPQNLKPNTARTPEERKALGVKAGKASGAARRRKREMRETLEILLSLPLKDGREDDIEKLKSLGSLRGKNVTVQDGIMTALCQKAAKGSVMATELIMNLMGENPAFKIEGSPDSEININVNYGE